ncbi:MAG: TonB-dependent receptor [Chitinophagaceae bacterium]|nr:MAG: TonB-dependent receptor [Chitinophagaceae bacterium]
MKNVCKGVLFSLLMLLSAVTLAQNKTISGKVVDSDGPVSGASVTIKGSTNAGTVTNDNGQFTLSVPAGTTTLVVSSIGYETREFAITGDNISVTVIKSAAASLDEVVVVGYGTQKKSVVTGSISSVKARDIENIPNGRIEQALQGRVAGVTIQQNSGQPGSGSTVRVRGVTTFGGNDPLWVVDGVVVDAGGIAYLNQSDIESIEVLKDAASAAIYGTRAATGVILVTTKKGRPGKPVVAYNGFYGTSKAARRLDLLDASQYATLSNERSVADGGAVLFPNASTLGAGTDWQDVIFNDKANRYLHEVSMSGGSERSTFYLSVGVQNQEGIVLSDISKYNKKNIRLNSTHKISNVFTFGQTLGYTHQKASGIGNTNNEFGGPLASAINLDPITKVIETDPAVIGAAPYSTNPVFRDANGNPYGISSIVGQELTNPLAYMQTRLGNYGWSDDVVGNVFLEAAVTRNIKVRSSLGAKKAFYGSQGFQPVGFLNANNVVLKNNFGKNEEKRFQWNIENTITYTKTIKEHNFTVLAGQAAYVENIGGGTNITLFELPITSYQDASFNFDIPQANRTSGGYDAVEHKISSLFGRVNYSFADRYLFTGIIRRDGSSRFGTNNKFGVFPSFSAGWNVNREAFWPTNNVVKNLKVRGGYGVVGSDNLADFRYLATVGGGYNYVFGNAGAVTTGYAPRTLDNPDLRWEETSSTDIGFDAQILNDFNLTVNWFKKKTSGILRPVNIPGYVGVAESPFANIADMQNTGIEVELGYRKQVGEVAISANGNMTYLKNKVTFIDDDNDFIGGDASFQSMGQVTRTQIGQSYNSFYGYRTLGIFQNENEITGYKNNAGTVIQPNARPGDFRWQDTNGDGAITEDDKVFLGTNIPKFNFGLTINLEYKGFDFMAFAQGSAGSKIFQGLRRLDVLTANYSTRALDRWHGEGTSNSFPRLVTSDPNQNFTKMSDFYLEKGDYVRLKVMQVGYTLPSKLFGKSGISRLRVYVTAENLFTLTDYTGYDPEVGGGVFGVDKGQYPQARTFLGGLQLQF